MTNKTYDDLGATTTVDATDLVATYAPPSGPMKKIVATDFFGAAPWAIRALTPAADKAAYFTSASAAALMDFTGVGRTLVGQSTQALMRTAGLGMSDNGSSLVSAADYSAMRTLLSLVPGTDVQPYNAQLAAIAANSTNGFWARSGAGTGAARSMTGTASQIDVTNGDGVSGAPTFSLLGNALALAGLTGAADKLAYFTGSAAMALTNLVSQARSFLADPSATFVNFLQAGTGAVLRTLQNWLQDHVSVKDFSATAGDGIQFSDGAITSGTATLTSASSTFTVADVGKIVVLRGAGAAGATLLTTISAYVSAHVVTLADNASTTVSGAIGCYGTDSAAAITAAQARLTALGGGILDFPNGGYLYASQLTVATKVTWRGRGKSLYATTAAPAALMRAFASGAGIVVAGDVARMDDIGVSNFGLAGNGVEVNASRFGSRDSSFMLAGAVDLRIGSSNSANTFNMNAWTVENPTVRSSGSYGILVHDAKTLPDVNAGVLSHADVDNCVNHGIYLENAWDNILNEPVCQSNGGTGVRIGGSSRNTTVYSPYTEANANNEIVIDAGAVNTRILGTRSGVNLSGYVDNGTGSEILQTRSGITGYYWNKLTIGGLGAGITAILDLYAGVNEINAGKLIGRDGAVGTAGEVAIQVKRNGDAPIDRLVLSDGAVTLSANTSLIVTTSQTPASAAATGTAGTIAWDSGYLYVCTATDTWKRVAIATW